MDEDIDRREIISNAVEEAENKGKLLVLILVGAPGSGKSTFSDHLLRLSSRPWVRICQDTIGNGKAGTKIQCVKSATTALKDGKSVLIDRCNLDIQQRKEFVQLGGPLVEKHAVVLDLPAKLCISRSVERTGHEGNLQGGKAAAVVNRMLQKKELPKLSEGFARITFCQDEKEVQAALKTYSDLGPLDTLPPGCFGQKNPNAKVQLGIMNFLKKVDVCPSVDSAQNPPTVKQYEETLPTFPERLSAAPLHAYGHEKVNTDDGVFSSGDAPSDSIPTLAFPSISTADFCFNLERASDIIVEKVEEFFTKLGNARLVLVDLSQRSKILSLVRSKAAQRNIDSSKFLTHVGDITKLYSGAGLHCSVIANAANWRLKPGGGGVNAAIFSAAGPALETATKERAGSLMPGEAVLVPLPPYSPLFSKERIAHVIHVLGPNMNPQRPNCLKDDYATGCRVLRQAYSSLFEAFASIMRNRDDISSENIKPFESQDHIERGSQDFDQKAKRDASCESVSNKKYKGTEELGPSVRNSADREDKARSLDKPGKTKCWGSWGQALYQISMSPEKHKNDITEISEDVIVLNDMYPKARKHLLVLARACGIDSLADVCKENLPLLKTMHAVGVKWVEKFLIEDESLVFRLGYHSVPSMRQLHLHVVSQDFDSKHLKNKKHWNSFNSPFFRDSVDVIEEVNRDGKATFKGDESFLSMELRCNRCRSAHPNIPRLKAHTSSCRAPFPSYLLENGRLISASSKDSSHLR